jgi:hypothetical protein
VHAITNSGWVEVITGCMFSGKTEELLRRLRRAEIAGQEVAAFTPNVDARFGTAAIGSYVGRRIEADVVDTEDPLPGMREALNGESIVAVDEVNFFSEALLDACDELADDGRRVRGRRSTGSRTTVDGSSSREPTGRSAASRWIPSPRSSPPRSTSTSSGPSAPAVANPRPVTSGSSRATPHTTTVPRSWSGPRSPTRRAVGTATPSDGTDYAPRPALHGAVHAVPERSNRYGAYSRQ